MTENTKIPAAQATIEDPPEYNAETPAQNYTKHRFSETSTKEEGSDWLGGPQNGDELPGKSTEEAYQQNGQSAKI